MKVLVLGTSHTGAYLFARDEIAAQFPSLDIHYFAFPGEVFARASVKDGIFSCQKDDDRLLNWSPQRQIDLRDFDHILSIGTRFRCGLVTRLLAWYDVLEDAPSGDKTVISRDAMQAFIQDCVDESFRELVERDLPLHKNVTYIPAPQVLARSLQKGTGYDPHADQIYKRENLATWMDFYGRRLAEKASQYETRILAQPKETLSGPVLTLDKYARIDSAAQHGGTKVGEKSGEKVDNRHMNAEFGQLCFRVFARDILGLSPATPQETL